MRGHTLRGLIAYLPIAALLVGAGILLVSAVTACYESGMSDAETDAVIALIHEHATPGPRGERGAVGPPGPPGPPGPAPTISFRWVTPTPIMAMEVLPTPRPSTATPQPATPTPQPATPTPTVLPTPTPTPFPAPVISTDISQWEYAQMLKLPISAIGLGLSTLNENPDWIYGKAPEARREADEHFMRAVVLFRNMTETPIECVTTSDYMQRLSAAFADYVNREIGLLAALDVLEEYPQGDPCTP